MGHTVYPLASMGQAAAQHRVHRIGGRAFAVWPSRFILVKPHDTQYIISNVNAGNGCAIATLIKTMLHILVTPQDTW